MSRLRGLLGRVLAAGVLLALGAALVLLLQAAWYARLVTPKPSVLYQDRFGRFLALLGEGPGGEQGFWKLDPVPPRVALATVALEDKRFWYHPGVDPLAVLRAAMQNLRQGQRVSGASTLAMQIARMQHPAPRTLWAKAREALTALLLTARYGREALLAHYLAWAPYGNRIRGIGLAAQLYLGKHAADLSWAEIAYLVAIPKAPTASNPCREEGHQRLLRRAAALLGRLAREGVVSPGELELAQEQLRRLRPLPKPTRPTATLQLALAWQRAWSRSPAPARPLVTTTLDLELVEALQRRLAAHLAAVDPMGVANGALLVVALPTREVLAVVSSAGFFHRNRAGAYDYTALPRLPGSTLKPFLYAQALQSGLINAGTVLDDLQPTFGITNADGAFLGPLLPAQALACSRNVPAAWLLSRLGTSRFLHLLQELGVLPALPSGRAGLGVAVGGVAVTLRDLVAGYAALACDGKAAPLVWVRGDAPQGRQVLDPSAARLVTAFLADPLARLPVFPRHGPTEFPFPVAVKTGTSPGGRDGWTVAYSRAFLVGAWVGRADWQRQEELTGYSFAARLVKETLLALHPEAQQGLADWAFPPPEGFVPVQLCGFTGKLPGPNCSRILATYLRPGELPAEHCQAHGVALVDRRTGRLATAATPRKFVEKRAFLRLPPRYARWLSSQNLAPPLPPQQAPTPVELGSVLSPPVRLAVTYPPNNARLFRDPEAPPEASTLELAATVDPPVPQLLWLVDGRPARLVGYPYAFRWPLVPGTHRLQVAIPATPLVSSPVTLEVR